MKTKFIIDAFTLRRGEPLMLEISCSKCRGYLITYQKDGPGPLLRCYFDRIHVPKFQHMPDALVCLQCHQYIGEKAIYEKENRLAFILTEGAINIKQLE